MALCLNCGEIKFGALCPCSKCAAPANSNIDLNIVFSDHLVRVKKLRFLGRILQSINAGCEDPDFRYWAFIYYVSKNFPTILTAKLSPEVVPVFESFLMKCDLPKEEADKRRGFPKLRFGRIFRKSDRRT